jgi:prephenate dehydrogenase
VTTPKVTIIGLGLVGGSIGLGLNTSSKAIRIVGHDVNVGRGKLAQKMGAVHESRLNLLNACDEADLVVIATPITAIRETLELIGPHLKQGCVITDTATLKQPLLAWAAETLPKGIHFVGGDPLLNPNTQPDSLIAAQGLEQARADLFQDALYALCPAPETSPTAVKRVSDMIKLLQARPFFVDPIEHDGMRAAVEGLPTVVALALMQEISGSPGWQEARKLADHTLGTATMSVSGAAEELRARLLLNASYLVPRVDALMHGLAQLREWLATKNGAALEEALNQAATERTRWLLDREKGDWEEELAELGISGTLGSLGNLLGLGSRSSKPKDE